MRHLKRSMRLEKLKKVYSMLGLATRAGRIKSGEFSTEQAVKCGDCFLCIVADDASDNTKKRFRDMCAFYEVPIIFLGTRDDIGHAIGKEHRASVAVCDEGFAGSIRKLTSDSLVLTGTTDLIQEDGKI